MRAADIARARAPHADPEVRLEDLFGPFLRRWRLVAGAVLLAWAAALAAILLPPREYKAEIVLAAVPNTKMASLAGGLSSLLGNAQLGGVQSTPYFITRLLMLPGVLQAVAHSPADDGTGRAVFESVIDRPAAEIKPQEIVPAMRDVLSAEVDKQTGLVTFGVTLPDSALARRIAERVLAVGRTTFVKVVRAQATDQREAGQARVDSARRQLRQAEAAQQDFQASHRTYASYAAAAVVRQRLERDLTDAQTAYNQAITDQQSAVARELEETPAVVVVDPIPALLTPEPRQALLKLLLATVVGMAAAACVMLLRGDFRGPRLQRDAEGVRSAA